jgi:hypothetical protein
VYGASIKTYKPLVEAARNLPPLIFFLAQTAGQKLYCVSNAVPVCARLNPGCKCEVS